MHQKIACLLVLLSSIWSNSLLRAQEIGANFNHDPEIIDITYLKKTPVEWIRTTPYIFEYINGQKDPASSVGLAKVIEAKKAGYKVAFGFRWDFRKYNLSIPEPGSAEEKKYFGVAMAILDRVGPYIDVFKLGNEPNLETKEEDLQKNAAGVVPLVRFTQRLLSEVVAPYYKSQAQLKRPDVYVGSFPALFESKQQQLPAVVELIKWAHTNKDIKGLSIHLHIADSSQMDEVFRFVRNLMPAKPIIVPEYSLFRLYNKHVGDELGDSPEGIAFAQQYGYASTMKLHEWYSKANTQRVSAQEWSDFFASRKWFPQHFMQTYYRYFKNNGVVLATYGYFSQSAPQKVGPGTPIWFVNPIFPGKSLLPHADGSIMENPLWYQDFVDAANMGKESKAKQPNIVLIYIDDLGFGDVSCYGATGVQTPHVDRLAKSGVLFTDGHCTAATCTPSRYSLLTGRYAFRNDAAILPGDAPLLIKPGSASLPALLQKAGYATGVVGKWHLGLGMGTIDWNQSISPGPLEVGFDYSYIIPATTDRVPTVYVENHRVVNQDPADPIEVSYQGKTGNEPEGLDHPELLKMKADTQHSNTIINGISRIGYMKGGHKARWRDEDIADVLTERAKAFIKDHQDKPFFLYFSVPDVHVPRAPHERFVGATAMGKRGDVIAEMDWMTGEITKQIEALGLTNQTLVIFTSDNGPVLDDGYEDEAEKLVGSHQPSGRYRGGKYSAFEGGTRVPFIASMPGKIKPGVSNALFSQIDLLASLAALAGQSLPADAAMDSENRLPVLLGQSNKGRDYMLEEAFTLALRKGNWKYIAPQEKGTPGWLKNKKIETGLMQVPQLYNLTNDPGEQHNLASQHPELVQQFEAELNRTRKSKGTRKDDSKNK